MPAASPFDLLLSDRIDGVANAPTSRSSSISRDKYLSVNKSYASISSVGSQGRINPTQGYRGRAPAQNESKTHAPPTPSTPASTDNINRQTNALSRPQIRRAHPTTFQDDAPELDGADAPTPQLTPLVTTPGAEFPLAPPSIRSFSSSWTESSSEGLQSVSAAPSEVSLPLVTSTDAVRKDNTRPLYHQHQRLYVPPVVATPDAADYPEQERGPRVLRKKRSAARQAFPLDPPETHPNWRPTPPPRNQEATRWMPPAPAPTVCSVSSYDLRPDRDAAADMRQGLLEMQACNEIFEGWAEELGK